MPPTIKSSLFLQSSVESWILFLCGVEITLEKTIQLEKNSNSVTKAVCVVAVQAGYNFR